MALHQKEDEEHNHPQPQTTFRYRYDVFLSFRGEDTRHTFTAKLYTALDSNGIRPFRDDEGLDRGSEVAPSLLAAIEESAASVIILSENYANSRWCLQELTKILECRRLILPVFYHVDPSDVRRRKGPFENDFRDHEERFGEDSVDVGKWKMAFEKLGGLSGYHTKTWEESELIQSIVQRILIELSNTPLGVAKHPVGINSRVEAAIKILNMKSDDVHAVHAVGFHGMGGIGKTTLAKAVYNKIVTKFEHRSFISDIRTASTRHKGLVSLQNRLIHDLFPDNPSLVDEVSDGIAMIKRKVHDKRVLIILDDVDNISQLDALAGKRDWFDAGSRIIVTTRDIQVLNQSLVNEIHAVKLLNPIESLELFSYHAFGKGKPTESFLHLSKSIVECLGQLPLALEVHGAFLFDKRREIEWESQLKKLKEIHQGDIHNMLKISYDGLDKQEQRIFLDIACFFVELEMQRESVVDILKGCGFNAEIAITVLTAKSLIRIVDGDTLWIHDQLRDMGREIVRQENAADPGMRSRLWDRNEIMSVLIGNKGTRSIEGIVLNSRKRSIQFQSSKGRDHWFKWPITFLKKKLMNHFEGEVSEVENSVLETKQFAEMVNLRLLEINHMILNGRFQLVPRDLKWLQWKGCPLNSLPSDFCARELAVLDLTESKIEHVWDQRWSGKKVAMKLMVLNLLGCFNLTATPDFSQHPNLEKLNLERCGKLTKIHKSVGDLKNLRMLNLKDCSNLVEFLDDVSGLRCLESLSLSGCPKLQKLPEDLRSIKSLKELLLDYTAIVKLPDSIYCLTKLESLSLRDCKSLKKLPSSVGRLISLRMLLVNGSSLEEIPDSIGTLINLETLWLMHCKSLVTLPDSIGSLKSLLELYLDSSSIMELPISIGSLSHLKILSASRTMLEKLPCSIGGLSSLVEFGFDHTLISELPDEIGNLNMLQKLNMRNCKSLCRLPDSIGNLLSLTSLVLAETNITELPSSMGQLENLVVLNVNKCTRLRALPSSVGNLKCLLQLLMEETSVTQLPDEFGMLSSLMRLKMSKPPNTEQAQNPQEMQIHRVLPVSFSNLSLLETLDAKNCLLSGKIPDDFEKLTAMVSLDLGRNNFCSLPSSMNGLTRLEKLSLAHCANLTSLPPLPSSLILLDATNCTALESISDVSKLVNLEELRLTNCMNVVDIPGLEHLQSLKRLFMIGCTTCHSVVRRRFSTDALRRLRNLSIPGSEIPEGFVQEVPSFEGRKNRKLQAVIICVVLSLNQQAQDDFRDKLPAIADIQARIVRDNVAIFTTTLYLIGVPKTDHDHIYMCRYLQFTPLVSLLKVSDKIEIVMRNPPCFNGLELKKYGIQEVFEDDDDDYGFEEPLDGIENSVTQKLTKFFRSSEGNARISNTGSPEVETSTTTKLNCFTVFRMAFMATLMQLGYGKVRSTGVNS